MYSNNNSLIQELKREVLSELNDPYYSTNPSFPINQGYTSTPYLNNLNSFNGSPPYPGNNTYQIMKESVKNEILAEMQAQQTQQMAQMYGFDRILPDQKIKQIIDGRYRALDNMKTDLKKELQSIQRMENQRTADPYIRQVANSLVQEARQQGVPLEQVVQSLDQKSAPGTGMMSRISNMLNTGQRRGFLYGIGAAFLFNLIWPSARNNLHSAAVRTMEEGMSLANRAKSFVGGHNDAEMNMSFDDFDSEPQGPRRPPEVDILKQ